MLSSLQLIAFEAAPAPQQINNSPFAVRECLIQRGPTKHGLHIHATPCQGKAVEQSLYYHSNQNCCMLIRSCVMKLCRKVRHFSNEMQACQYASHEIFGITSMQMITIHHFAFDSGAHIHKHTDTLETG